LIEDEITQLRESNLVQKKRLLESVNSVLKDLAEVGNVFGGELKVLICVFQHAVVVNSVVIVMSQYLTFLFVTCCFLL